MVPVPVPGSAEEVEEAAVHDDAAPWLQPGAVVEEEEVEVDHLPLART